MQGITPISGFEKLELQHQNAPFIIHAPCAWMLPRGLLIHPPCAVILRRPKNAEYAECLGPRAQSCFAVADAQAVVVAGVVALVLAVCLAFGARWITAQGE